MSKKMIEKEVQEETKKLVELSRSSIYGELLLEICVENLALQRNSIDDSESNQEKKEEIFGFIWRTVNGIVLNVAIEMGISKTPLFEIILLERLRTLYRTVKPHADKTYKKLKKQRKI